MESDISLDLLERPSWTLTLLVYLLKNGPSNIAKIEKDLGIPRQSIYGASKKLEELNFIFRKTERAFPTKVYLHLTQQGEGSAELLSRVNALVKETLEGYRSRLGNLREEKRTRDTEEQMSDILCKLASLTYSQGRWNEAVEHGEECLSLARKLGNRMTEAKSNWILGDVHLRRGETQKAMDNLKRCMELFTEFGDKEHLSSVHYSFGAIAERKGDYDGAIEEYERSEKQAEEAHYDISRGRSILGKGRVLGRKGLYEESHEEMMKATRILEAAKATEELPRAYANIGATSAFIDIDESIKWHRKSIDVAREVGDYRIAAYGWMNLAGCLMKKSEHREALRDLKRALDVATDLDDKSLLSSIYIQIGVAQTEEEEWDMARESLGRAIDIAKAANLPYNRAEAVLNLGRLDAKTSRLDRARERLMIAMEIFEELSNLDKVAEVKEALERISNL